jgi:hypothetical protein
LRAVIAAARAASSGENAMHRTSSRAAWLIATVLLAVPSATDAAATEPARASVCAAASGCERLVAADPARCAALEAKLRRPNAYIANGQIDLDAYEKIAAAWMGGYCYRALKGDAYAWPHDPVPRDTGPFFAQIIDGKVVPKAQTTHVVARVWYSPDMHAWMMKNRPADESKAPANPDPIPTGAIVVKEMWPSPFAQYADTCFDCIKPGSGAVFFVRDEASFSAGWFTGWWGDGYKPDWPPASSNPLTSMGDGGQQFCSNCHASTHPGNTFVSMNNLEGEPATFLTQWVPPGNAPEPAPPARHVDNAIASATLERIDDPLPAPDSGFARTYVDLSRGSASPANMPSQTFDSVLVPGHGPLDHFMPSSQCVGCHQAGATGLQIDMLDYGASALRGESAKPVSVSPYSLWSTSPMGLAGRDPIFYAQLESEQIFHADMDRSLSRKQKTAMRAVIQDTCLQCHGVMGQRQQAIDSHAQDGSCAQFVRATANAVPFPHGREPWAQQAQQATYGALARDGISCTVCHRLAIDAQAEAVKDLPWNACITQKQHSLNPDYTGFAATFTGTFPIGAADELNGPFEEPLVKPMENALRLTPKHNESLTTSEVCGSCHTIHLPVLDHEVAEDRCGPQTDPPDPFRCFPKRYEQTTYPEWAFSAYRTGKLGDEPLPSGAGATPRSCQDCHMPSRHADGTPIVSKIAAIEEYGNYPQTDYRLDAKEIDLPLREAYAQHTLVGLNLFLIEMAQQFPQVFGIRSEDPGLGGTNLAPLQVTENAILDQAANTTAKVSVDPAWDAATSTLAATVSIDNLVGHKFPSGVGFRRAFIEFSALDANGETLWISGATDDMGLIVDADGEPLPGELWWKNDCSARLPNAWQPHYQQISAPDQVQIYQELITDASGRLTTSFLAINEHVKENRLQPHGFLDEAQRVAIAAAFGDATPPPTPGIFAMDENLGRAMGPEGDAEHDPDYRNGSGVDRIVYRVTGLREKPASVRARVMYQSIPPFYLQDRFCTALHAKGTPVTDTRRLNWLVGNLDTDGPRSKDWKLATGDSGRVEIR